jgi:hypothetical protein
VPSRASLHHATSGRPQDFTSCTCRHRGRWSHAVEGGGAAVSCDEEGRRGVGWHAIKPPIVAAIEEEGSSKVTPPCKRERELLLLLLT